MKFNKKMVENADIGFKLRIWKKKKKGINSPKYLIKCGCCDNKVEIYYDMDDDFVEINGVNASKKEWSRILLPLLKPPITKKNKEVKKR